MKNWKKIISCALVATLVIAGMTGVFDKKVVSAQETEIAVLEDTINQVTNETGMVLHSLTSGKNETVFVILDDNGEMEKTIVSNTLKNSKGEKTLTDFSTLDNIRVVKGDSECIKNDSGNIEWKTNGSDVYYQGTTTKELPITVHIKYELDGKPVSAEELSDATGHLKMTFSYENNAKKDVLIDGKNCTIYQPFTLVSGLVLDNNKAVNVTVTNGEAIDSGETTMVFGLAMPGLKESLGIDNIKDIDIPEEVVIEADVIDFSLMMSLTIASNNALEKLGLDGIDTLDDLKNDMDKLKDGICDIEDGATQLSDGVVKLSDGTGTLSNGVDELNSGAAELKDGAYKLADGASALNDGANQLRDGLGSLKNSAPALVDGVGQLTSGADQLAAGISQITSNNDALNLGAAGLTDGLAQLNSALTDENATNSLSALVQGSDIFNEGLGNAAAGLNAIKSGYNYNEGELAAMIGGLESYALALMENPDTAAYGAYINVLINTYKGLYDNTATAADGVNTLNSSYAQIDGGIDSLAGSISQTAGAVGRLYAGSAQLQTGITSYTAGVNSVAQGISTVDSGLNSLNSMVPTLVNGINQLSDGANALADGSLELKNGSSSLAGGTDKLTSGTGDLKNGVSDLVNGVSELLDGSVELKDGVIKYDNEGINKLYDVVNDSLTTYYDRLMAVSDFAKEYKSFSGCENGIESSVRFIYKTGEIKKAK